jgi:CO/xanthine dehydrogenase FAD-binding subunit
VTGDHRFHHAVIGGHRCQAVTPSDLATALLALDAQVLLVAASGARRTVALEALYSGPGETVIGHDEILAEVCVPAESGGRLAVFEKLNLYQGDFAIAAIAVTAHVDASGRWTGVRLALGGMASTPLRLHATERALEGEIVTADALRAAMDRELDGIAHPLAGNEWKLDAASGLAHKAAERICVRGAPCAT